MGTATQGTTITQTFRITNSGQAAANVSAFAALGSGFSYPNVAFTGGAVAPECTNIIAGSSTCDVTIQYLAGAPGAVNSDVDVDYSDGAGGTINLTQQLDAISLSTALLTMVPTDDPLNFGDVAEGGLATQTFTVTNTGESEATAINFSVAGTAGPGVYVRNGGTCGTNLVGGIGANCTVILEYRPPAASAPLVHNDNYTLAYNNGAVPDSISRNLQGSSVAPGGLTLISGNPAYGNRPTGSTLTRLFTVENTGGVTLTSLNEGAPILGSDFAYSGAGYPGSGGTPCSAGTTLAVGATCTFEVSYNPVLQAAHASDVNVTFDDGTIAAAGTYAISLTGTGVAPADLEFVNIGTTNDFNPQTVTTTVTRSYEIRNDGGFEATSIGGTLAGTSGGQFVFTAP